MPEYLVTFKKKNRETERITADYLVTEDVLVHFGRSGVGTVRAIPADSVQDIRRVEDAEPPIPLRNLVTQMWAYTAPAEWSRCRWVMTRASADKLTAEAGTIANFTADNQALTLFGRPIRIDDNELCVRIEYEKACADCNTLERPLYDTPFGLLCGRCASISEAETKREKD